MHFCAKLGRGLYGLVQAARQWWKKFITELTGIGFVKGEVDPCLLHRRNESGLCIVIVYVDDSLCLGDKKALSTAVQEIRKKIKVKINYDLDNYLSRKLLRQKSSIIIHQPHIYKHLIKKILPIVTQPSTGNLKTSTTPGIPGFELLDLNLTTVR